MGSPSGSARLNVTEPVTGLPVGQAPFVTVAVGATLNRYVTVLSVLVDAVLRLPAPSAAAPAAIEAMTVPSAAMPLTATS